MYHKKKKNNTLVLGILTLILFIVVVGLNMFPKLRKIDMTSFFKDIEVKVMGVVTKPLIAVKNKVLLGEEHEKLQKKYNDLLKEKEAMDMQKAEIEGLKKQVNDLKDQLNLDTTLQEKEKIHATVINRTVGNWKQKLTIDKGKKDHVVNGMPVINSKGLIGITTKTTNHASSVQLLTSDKFNKISVRMYVNDHYVYGLLSGYKDGMFVIEGISENVEIKEDTVVTTTGMGKTFPAGLLVGTVKKVTTDHFDLAKIVEVTPSADFNDLSYVTVVRRDQNYDY